MTDREAGRFGAMMARELSRSRVGDERAPKKPRRLQRAIAAEKPEG